MRIGMILGGHLVAGHHGHRISGGRAAVLQHPPHARSPFPPPHPQAIFMIPNRPAPRLSNEGRWSKEFVDFVGKCLVKDPAQRASAKQLLEVRVGGGAEV